MTGFSAGIHRHAVADNRAPTLFRRLWVPSKGIYRNFSHVMLLSDGVASITLQEFEHVMTAPAACFVPSGMAAVIALEAGADACVVGVSDELMVDATGSTAESVTLRIFTERPAIVGDLELPEHDEIAALSGWFIDEVQDPARGSLMAIAAYMHLVLIAIRRVAEIDKPDDRGHGEVGTILQRFRHMVELHFRARWPIERYADELGITYDRLHGICRRTLKRSPIQLVHDRVADEARLRLERSGLSIKEIAANLGFSDPTNFSHFFKRKTGYAPAAYRRMTRLQMRDGLTELPAAFSDWP